MKILITGDWQLDSQPAHDVIGTDQRSTRFNETVGVIERIIVAAQAKGAEGMLHLGDLTENKNPKSVEMEAAAFLFNQVLGKGGKVWGIAGNHDGSIFSVSSSSLAPLARMAPGRFKVFHQVEVDEELHMLAIPYIHKADPEQVHKLIQQALMAYDARGPKVYNLFAAMHYGATGAALGVKNLVLAGDYLGEMELPTGRLDHVFFGHIHKGQKLMLGAVPAWGPGSPVICNMGEREDKKSWILFDTVTRQVEVFDVPQPRRWMEVTYDLVKNLQPGASPWTGDDIVALSGTYSKPDYPKDTLEAAFKAGLPRPFSLDYKTTAVRPEHVARGLDITAEGGLREALTGYVREKFKRDSDTPNIIDPATELAMGILEEQGAKKFCNEISPTGIELENFLTFASHDAPFTRGVPTLIVGPNGIGKTNFMEAPLWALTGKTSKGLALGGVVRQGADGCFVKLYLDDDAGQTYRISRSVKLTKAGKASQKLTLDRLAMAGEKQENATETTWISMSDGGVDEVQAIISSLVGGTYQTLKVTAFKFQHDVSPFIRTHPTERKQVIGELAGLEPLSRAFKILDKRRLDSARDLEAGKNRLGGMLAIAADQDTRTAQLQDQLAAAQAELGRLEADVPVMEQLVLAAKTGDTGAKAAVTAARTTLDQLPNTEAALQSAQQGLISYESTYTAGRETRNTRYQELQEKITALQAQLAGQAAPDPAAIAQLEEKVTATTKSVELQAEHSANANADLATATAENTAAKNTLGKLKGDLVDGLALVVTLGSMEDPAPIKTTLAQQQAALDAAGAVMQDRAAASAKYQAQADEATKALMKAIDDKKAFDGQDVGNCSRCGHELDSTHVLAELARIEEERVQAQGQLEAAGATKAVAQQDLVQAMTAKNVAQAEVTRLTNLAQTMELNNQKRTDALQRQQQLEGQVTAAGTAATQAQAKADHAAVMADALAGPLAIVRKDAADLAAQLKAMKDAGAKLAEDQGRLASMAEEDAKNVKAGEEEKAAYLVEKARLEKVVADAKAGHDQGQAIRTAAAGEVTRLQGLADTAAAQLLDASVKQQGVTSAVEGQRQQLENVQASLKAIDDQKKAVEAAKFELGLLEQKAAVDGAAAALLDPKKGLPIFLIDQALPFLEERINLYLAQLGMERLTVELNTLEGDSETLAVMVDNGRPGPRLDIAAFSGGQLDRIEYACKCAMADFARQSRGVTLGLACFDEPTGGLDEDGKEGLVKMLFERSATYPVTIIVSHDEKLIRSFDNRLRFSQGPNDETLVA